MKILGIDPGSRITGYGFIEYNGQKATCLEAGCLKLGNGPMPERLGRLFEGLSELVRRFKPDEAAIEQVFVHKNVASALKLGQARGVAIAAIVTNTLQLSEYAPREIKLAVVGTGSAEKQQVAHMVKALLCLPEVPQADAADALAVALCHIHSGPKGQKESWRNYDRKITRETD